jgi:Peptidase_C39 like family
MNNTQRCLKGVAISIMFAISALYNAGVNTSEQKFIDHSLYIHFNQAQYPIVQQSTVPTVHAEEAITDTPATFTKPKQSILPVQFFSQAPGGDWGDPYQNACEEMSILLVDAFLNGNTNTYETIDTAVRSLTSYVQNFGYKESINVQQLQTIATNYLGRNSVILEYPNADDIERSIIAGYPVIVPLAGRNLGNPHFMGEGPWYHMLVITGYTETTFVTQEVGTNFGANYEYAKEVILSNIHDFTGIAENIDSGVPRVLILL